MNQPIEIVLPSMGEGIYEATITDIFKKEGQMVEVDEAVLEVATDKIMTEIPSPAKGSIAQVKIKKGDVVRVGQVLATLSSDEEVLTPKKTPPPPVTTQPKPITSSDTSLETIKKNAPFLSPLVRSMLQKENISKEKLSDIQGSGVAGRITKKDILSHISENPSSDPENPTDAMDHEIVEMSHIRKVIASNMLESIRTAPHVTSVAEADMTQVTQWLSQNKRHILETQGIKVTYTPIIISAIIKALKDFPMMNISVEGSRIIKWKHINMGIATALEDGNLIVPVLKFADRLSFLKLTESITDLVQRARSSRLKAPEVKGGTYTFSNIGVFGNLIGTPIINQPQVAIMVAGVIQKKPAIIETPQGDSIGIRQKMYLSHTFDHRVIDGALGGSFLKRVADYLGNFQGIDV